MKKALTILTLLLFLGVVSPAADFEDVITALGARKSTLTIYKEYAITSTFAVPANVTLHFLHGGSFDIDGGETITINGPVISSPLQIFTGAGTAVVTTYPHQEAWWGNAQEWDFGTATIVSGGITLTGNLIIPDAGTIGSVSDPSAITIAADGKLTFTDDLTVNEDIIIGDGKYIGSASDPDAMQIEADGDIVMSQDLIVTVNLGIGVSAWGTAADKVLGIGGSTTPTTSPADMIQLWSVDRDATAGDAALHYRMEGGIARALDRKYDVRDYGASSTESAANNQQYMQDAIDAAPTGGVVVIPRMSAVYDFDNTTPLVIAHALTLIIQGEINFDDDTADFCDVTGDDVTIIGEGGKIKGPGTFDYNGAVIASSVFHVTGDRFTCRDLTIEDYVQCGIFLDGSADDVIYGIRLIGGAATAAWEAAPHNSGTQHYGIEIEDATTTNVLISNCSIVPNASDGITAQGVGGGTDPGLGHITITGCYFEGMHDHATYLFGDHNTITGNTINTIRGSAIRGVGQFLTITGNVILEGGGGGIEARNTKGTTITGNTIINFNNNGIEISEYGTYTDSFDNIVIANNTMIGDTSGFVYSGVGIDASDRSADNIVIANNIIQNADYSGDGYHGIWVRSDGSDTIDRLKIDGNLIDTVGGAGIVVDNVSSGSIANNYIRDPAQQAAVDGGIVLVSDCDDIYIHHNQIIKETGANAMDYGIYITATNPDTITGCILENNKIDGDDTEEIYCLAAERVNHTWIMTDSSGFVGINRPVPNASVPLEIGGNIAIGFSDTGKISLHNAAEAEGAYLALSGGSDLIVDADADIVFQPNNINAGRWDADGHLYVLNNLVVTGTGHDAFSDFVANEHIVLPNTIANVLSDHNLAGHVGLGLLAAVSAADLAFTKAVPMIQFTDSTYGTAFDLKHHAGGSFTLGETGAYDIEILAANAGILMANLKAGITQVACGAVANELWIDTDDDRTLKVGN